MGACVRARGDESNSQYPGDQLWRRKQLATPERKHHSFSAIFSSKHLLLDES
ncbi:unnamed protein product [Plutella xylostella]|uniref:(diamondback moth) hypothetical protein n=1 Tax=Plutella xylostella TaxID=51655 RepID=A0A8S4FPG2_PLUXY|nr:unnamed protein product [Plutella xylostella]